MKLENYTVNTLQGIAAKNSHAKSDTANKSGVRNSAPQISFTGVQNFQDELIGITEKALQRERDIARKAFQQKLSDARIPKTIKQIAKECFTTIKDGAAKFYRNNISEGCDITYDNYELVKKHLASNFGTTFQDCRYKVENFNHGLNDHKHGPVRDFMVKTLHFPSGQKDKFVYIINEDRDTITFHKDPFVKNVCFNIKEFVVGNLLDAGVGIRNKFRDIHAKLGRSRVIDPRTKRFSSINKLLDKRIAETEARDAYYRIMGVFEKAFDGVDKIKEGQIVPENGNLVDDIQHKIVDNIKNLSKNSLNAALKKSGNYNTKTERAMNRLGTGFVSACFAATDFYNISMLQNNDKKKADKAKHKRFSQDMRRQCLTAGITYIVLGSLQKNVNKSVLAAVLSLGGVTLISEVLSRMMGGISLVPLSPEKAREKALKQEKIKEEKAKKEKPAFNRIITNNLPVTLNLPDPKDSLKFDPKYDAYRIFTDKIEYNPYSTNKVSFKSGKAEDKTKKEPKKKSSVLKTAGKILGGVIGATLAMGFLRSRNVLGIDDFIKSLSAKYQDLIDIASRKRLIMAKDDVDGFLHYLNTHNYKEQYLTLNNMFYNVTKHGAMSGQSKTVQKFVPKKEINPDGLYYDLGYVQSKTKKTVVDFITYPINFVSKLTKKTSDLIKAILCPKTVEPEKTGVTEKQAVEFMEKYATRYRDALIKGEMYEFDNEIKQAFTKHFSEANSVNKNTTVAMLSRFLITFITGYFFVNDYRNQVLIESKGEDVEGANATARERVGHKIANFFLNSMFMDFFNTTFERAYLSSVFGATAVAMATEVTNETAVRASICTPTRQMDRDELIAYEKERLEDDGILGTYYRNFMKITGKKPLSEKAKK